MMNDDDDDDGDDDDDDDDDGDDDDDDDERSATLPPRCPASGAVTITVTFPAQWARELSWGASPPR